MHSCRHLHLHVSMCPKPFQWEREREREREGERKKRHFWLRTFVRTLICLAPVRQTHSLSLPFFVHSIFWVSFQKHLSHDRKRHFLWPDLTVFNAFSVASYCFQTFFPLILSFSFSSHFSHLLFSLSYFFSSLFFLCLSSLIHSFTLPLRKLVWDHKLNYV